MVLSVLSGKLMAQFQFAVPDIRVIEGEQELVNPFTGGINSAQYNAIDLDGDGTLDLAIFDRTSNKLSTYISSDNTYHYESSYEATFPAGLVSWVLLRDYDCDGLVDLFTDSQQGMRVFRNEGGSPPAWEPVVDPVKTLGSQVINLFFNASDIASIDDLDGDGDLDVLAYNFATGENIDYHQNMSMERTGACGLDFVRITRTYGGLSECNCGEFVFNEPCPVNGRILHTGGKAILSIDLDNDGDKELLSGEETCDELSLFTNQGDPDNAVFTGAVNFLDMIASNDPIYFPASYQLDLDFDGTLDLALSTNFRENDLNLVDFTRSSYLVRNTGTNALPTYELVGTTFLQEDMIDVGERAYPVVLDFDRDGDQDLFIGSRGANINNILTSSLAYYENTGSVSDQEFTLRSADFLGLSSLDLLDIRPQFTDMTGDGRPDLLFTGKPADGATQLYLIPNSSSGTYEFDASDLTVISDFNLLSENPFIVDIDQDGAKDLLVGRTIGTLEYYRNINTNRQPEYVLEDDELLDLETSIERINLVPLVYDLARDGRRDLIVSDATGQISIYEDFLESNPSPVRQIVQNPLISTAQSTDFGRISWPVMTDLYNAGNIDLLVGTIGGGLQVLQDSSGFDQSPNEELQVEVFPNPSQGNPVVIRSNANGTFQVISISGQQVLPETSLQANQPFILDPVFYQAGVFLIRFIATDGDTLTRKLVVNN